VAEIWWKIFFNLAKFFDPNLAGPYLASNKKNWPNKADKVLNHIVDKK